MMMGRMWVILRELGKATGSETESAADKRLESERLEVKMSEWNHNKDTFYFEHTAYLPILMEQEIQKAED